MTFIVKLSINVIDYKCILYCVLDKVHEPIRRYLRRCVIKAARQLRPLRHHIYRGAVVGVRGAAVGAKGAVVGVRGAAVGNIGMHTYIRHTCAPVHVLQQYI